MGKYEFRRDLTTEGGRERADGGRDPGCKNVHHQEANVGGSVGVPPSHFRSLYETGDMLRGWGSEMTAMVAEDCGRYSIEGHDISYFLKTKWRGSDGNPAGVAGKGSIWSRVE